MDTNTDLVIMNALKQVLPLSTRLASLGGPIYIQDRYSLSTGSFPALHLSVGLQHHHIQGGPNVYDGVMRIVVEYYDRWDAQFTTIDAVWAAIASDLQQMKVNVQENNSLTVNAVTHAVSIPTINISPYEGELDQKSCPGLSLCKRSMTLTVQILPYDA